MKKNYLLTLACLSLGLAALPASSDDQLPTAAPAAPASAVSPPLDPPAKPVAPAKKAPAPKKAAKSTAAETAPAAPVTPGPALARQNNINVRGQAAINSEVVTRLKRGDRVTVLEEVTLKKPKTDEPAKWAKIALPASTAVWVHSTYIDANKTVIPKRLNLRSGPGENYSVIGRLEKGATIKDIETKGEWIKIEAPAGAYGFVASHLLVPDAGAPMIAATEPAKAPETPAAPATPAAPPTTPEAAPAAPATPPATPAAPTITTPAEMVEVTPPATPATPAEPTITPATPATPVEPAAPVTTPAAPAEPAPAVAAPSATPAPAEEAKPEELIKRVITREGIVKRAVSIQAPSFFVLESIDTGKTVNYVFSSSTNIMLQDFRGQRIVVTGEEQLDERWPNTPVIYVESLQAVP